MRSETVHIYRALAAACRSALGGARVLFLLFRQYVPPDAGDGVAPLDPGRLPPGGVLAGAALHGRLAVVNRPPPEGRVLAELRPWLPEPPQAVLLYPLRAGGQNLGALLAWSAGRPPAFTVDHLAALQTALAAAAQALGRQPREAGPPVSPAPAAPAPGGTLPADLHILQELPVAVCVFNRDLCVEAANPAFLRLVHATDQQVRGRPLPAVLPPLSLRDRQLLSALRDALAGRSFHAAEVALDGEARTGRYFKLTVAPVRNAAQAVVGGSVLLVEVTEQVRVWRELARVADAAEQARTRLYSIIQSIPEAVVIFDRELRVVLLNPAARRLAWHVDGGYQLPVLRELNGEPCGVQHVPAYRAVQEAGEPVTRELRVSLQDGQDRLVSAQAVPLRDAFGRVVGAVMVLQDITVFKEVERLKDEFIGLVSHELRTPLTTIRAGARTLLQYEATMGEEARRQLLEDLEEESERLSRLVENLLNFTKTAAGIEVASEPVRVPQVVEKLERALTRTLRDRELRVVAAPDLPPVEADPVYLEQILRNLVENAAKYSLPDAPIELHAELAAGEMRFAVLDRGPGIPAGELEHIFEPFHRAADVRRVASGVGLGLAVCRRLVEAQGGRIWAAAREGGGTAFYFALPVAGEA
ncbi:MAG TPA: PAS domain-containing protein [Dehalococcoidia bacterium]